MKIVELIRLEESKNGTIGVLKVNKQILCMTLEPPDLLNKLNVSSIPARQYIGVPRLSQRFGQTFEVSDVPGRTDILFHAGNTVKHTAGCILVGSSIGKINASPALRCLNNSGDTFKRFAQAVGVGKEFHLTIREVY